jgi:enterobactin synthetase component D
MDDAVNWTIAELREILPRSCGVACKSAEPPPEILTVEEAGRLKNLRDARRGDFIAGRGAARDALAQVGIHSALIPSGPNNEPVWPPGVVGSISHAGGSAVAVVARSDVLEAIGIDIELTATVTSEIWADIFQESEMAFVLSQPVALRRPFATAIFCLKEAFYKYQFPQARQWLEFKDVEVLVEAETNQGLLRPKRPVTIAGRDLSEVAGHYRIGINYTLAAVF